MPITTSRLCIYILLIAVIIVLLYIKNKQEDKNIEHFTVSAFNIKVTSGQSAELVINKNNLLVNIFNTLKNDAFYLALIKIDGLPRIIDSYATGVNDIEDKRFQQDLLIYFNKAKLLSDKYIILFTKGSAYTKLSNDTKNFIKTNLGANRIFDVNATMPYILIYDSLDQNVRVEQTDVIGNNYL